MDILDQFSDQLDSLEAEGYLQAATDEMVALTRDGLLRVDRRSPVFSDPST